MRKPHTLLGLAQAQMMCSLHFLTDSRLSLTQPSRPCSYKSRLELSSHTFLRISTLHDNSRDISNLDTARQIKRHQHQAIVTMSSSSSFLIHQDDDQKLPAEFQSSSLGKCTALVVYNPALARLRCLAYQRPRSSSTALVLYNRVHAEVVLKVIAAEASRHRAAHAVLYCQELLEQILMFLPEKKVFTMRRVNTNFNRAARGLRLGQHTFLRSAKCSINQVWIMTNTRERPDPPLKYSPSLITKPAGLLTGFIDTQGTDIVRRPIQLNQVLFKNAATASYRVGTGPFFADALEEHLHLWPAYGLEWLQRSPAPSFMDCFVSQPPATHAILEHVHGNLHVEILDLEGIKYRTILEAHRKLHLLEIESLWGRQNLCIKVVLPGCVVAPPCVFAALENNKNKNTYTTSPIEQLLRSGMFMTEILDHIDLDNVVKFRRINNQFKTTIETNFRRQCFHHNAFSHGAHRILLFDKEAGGVVGEVDRSALTGLEAFTLTDRLNTLFNTTRFFLRRTVHVNGLITTLDAASGNLVDQALQGRIVLRMRGNPDHLMPDSFQAKLHLTSPSTPSVQVCERVPGKRARLRLVDDFAGVRLGTVAAAQKQHRNLDKGVVLVPGVVAPTEEEWAVYDQSTKLTEDLILEYARSQGLEEAEYLVETLSGDFVHQAPPDSEANYWAW